MTAATSAVAASVARARREIVQALRNAGAVSEAAATPYKPVSHLGARILPRMIRQGLVHETAAGALWLDEPAFAAHVAKQRRFALIAIALAVVAVGIVVLIGLGLGASR